MIVLDYDTRYPNKPGLFLFGTNYKPDLDFMSSAVKDQ
jgi:hypothetical protein